jgi:hypothetical protein
MSDSKNAKIFQCFFCDFVTCNKYNFNKHLATDKHNRLKMAKEKMQDVKKSQYFCDCGKMYIYQSSLCKHKKICNLLCNKTQHNTNDNGVNHNINNNNNNINNNNINNNNNNNNNNLICELITKNDNFKNILLKENEEIKKENKELKNQILGLIPKLENITNNISNNNITNNITTTNINNKININVFLNEKCKDAMSIDEFVNNIQISINNLLTTKTRGLGIGLTEIINENMNKLSVYERPIHCTDKKREILYIKNKTWEKDNDKTHTSKMLKALQSHQFKTIKKWIQEHPNYNDDEELKLEYMILVNKCSASLNEHERKLLKNICDSTYIKDDNTLE